MTLPLCSLKREVRASFARWYYFSGNDMAFFSWGMIGPSLFLLWDLKMIWKSFATLGEMASDHELLTSLTLRLRQVRSLVCSLI